MGDALGTAVRLAVLALVIVAIVAYVSAARRRDLRAAPDGATLSHPLAPAPTVARSVVAFVALGMLGYALPRVPTDGPAWWLPLAVGSLAVAMLWTALVPLLRDVLDAVRPEIVVGTVTDRRRHVLSVLGDGGPREVADCFVTVVDDGGATREYQVRPEVFGRCDRGDQVRLAVATRSGYVHSVGPARVGRTAGDLAADRGGAGAGR